MLSKPHDFGGARDLTMALGWLEVATWMYGDAEGEVLHVRAAACGSKVPPLEPHLAGRQWGRPSMHNGRIEFLYRSEADLVLDGIKQYRPTKRCNAALSSYLRDLPERLEVLDADDPLIADEPDDQLLRQRLLDLAVKGEIDPGGDWNTNPLFHVHGTSCEEGGVPDSEFELAARSLKLPVWATLDLTDAGGPGSGYSQPVIKLRAGKAMADLFQWLVQREDADRRTARKHAGRSRPTSRTRGRRGRPSRRP